MLAPQHSKDTEMRGQSIRPSRWTIGLAALLALAALSAPGCIAGTVEPAPWATAPAHGCRSDFDCYDTTLYTCDVQSGICYQRSDFPDFSLIPDLSLPLDTSSYY